MRVFFGKDKNSRSANEITCNIVLRTCMNVATASACCKSINISQSILLL